MLGRSARLAINPIRYTPHEYNTYTPPMAHACGVGHMMCNHSQCAVK